MNNALVSHEQEQKLKRTEKNKAHRSVLKGATTLSITTSSMTTQHNNKKCDTQHNRA